MKVLVHFTSENSVSSEISCTQDLHFFIQRGAPLGHVKKHMCQLFFHEKSVLEISKP